MDCDKTKEDSILINEVQLLLAEKRTSLAVMRTGIAVLVLPLTVLSFLIATSKYYDVLHVLSLIIPLSIFLFLLSVLGCYLIIKSILRMQRYDGHIKQIKMKSSVISEFIH